MNKLLLKSFWILAVSTFLVACGDDSSDSLGTSAKGDYCKVVKKRPFTIESVQKGVFSQTTFEYDEGMVLETVWFDRASAVDAVCSVYKNDSDYRNVRCEDRYVFAIAAEEMTSDQFNEFTGALREACEGVSGE